MEENVVDISSQKSCTASFTNSHVGISPNPKVIVSPDQKMKNTQFLPISPDDYSSVKIFNQDLLPDTNWVPTPGACFKNRLTMHKALQEYSTKHSFSFSRKCSYYNKLDL